MEEPREPLWLKAPYAPLGTQQGGAGGRRPAVFDQTALVSRKFKEVRFFK